MIATTAVIVIHHVNQRQPGTALRIQTATTTMVLASAVLQLRTTLEMVTLTDKHTEKTPNAGYGIDSQRLTGPPFTDDHPRRPRPIGIMESTFYNRQ